mmetsp:Transcript_25592/g.40999  ORF Transcript_25592/g.40999 Transcript_25592/m.40999 type:complete len:176 (-) Transcript_25592:68-595(-)|eukprot:CAMPEP_0115069014 /NCGR_PEP_ID=MMETSP0227-20121206/12321_1 /TAXON_ID=89957 /ORGANISM="Polarella glacialis, Strain CCMP 1383" /LENGTH=175 /DNA_ID=CAMNT_0002455367 /DNA_START=207 /DNA_END=734 /DNA_ORIENTATION=-
MSSEDSLVERFFDQSFTGPQELCVVAMCVMLAVVGVCMFMWTSDVYRLLPGWGPIRKFDSTNAEDQRIRQILIHQHAERLQVSAVLAANPQQRNYGSIGKPTWGVLESPNQTETSFVHPVHGPCKIREGFDETQKMRMASSWWAKDEPHFLAKRGLQAPEAQMNEPYISTVSKLV